MSLRVLLIAYKYPPYAGVGAYRWAKLTKYFAKSGVQVHVVTVDWRHTGSNTLCEDVKSENIIVHRIPCVYPYNLSARKFNSRVLSIARYFFLGALNKFLFWDDEAQYWGRDLLRFCERLICEEKINTLIATGHPFQSIRHASEIKRKIPELKFIADFRDPWFQHRKSKLTHRRFFKLRAAMEKALIAADLNVFVTRGLISEYLDQIDPVVRESIDVAHIPNGVDVNLEQPLCPSGPFDYDFIHAGNITNGREEPLERFLLGLQKIQPSSSVLLIGKVPEAIVAKFGSMKNLVVSESVSQAEVFDLIAKSRYALQLNARHVPYSVSTKIYEYPALGRPTISINYGGEVADLIEEYALGFSLHADSNSFDAELADIVGSKPPDVVFPPSFSYASIAQHYLGKVRQLHL